jgi:hypothetical protein
VAGSCDCGNELSGPIQCGGISCLAQNRLASKEGLCSKENNVLILSCCGKRINIRSVLGHLKVGNYRSRLTEVL